jgi:putative hydrolase of the HAD superfamily
MIKNLIFDLGGVIVPLNRIACLRAFDEIVGYKDFGEVLNSYRQIGFFEKFENGEISAKKFRQIIRINASPIKDGQKRVIKDREIEYSLNRFLCDIPQYKIETLLFFQGEYRMFLLSNTNPIGMSRVRELFKDKGYKIEELFEILFLSYKMKCGKPGDKIFNDMAKKAKIKPEESLFIDDSLANIEAANRLGYNTIHYNTKDDLYKVVTKKLEELEEQGK